MLDARRTINIAQACARAGVCRRTIYNWIAQGKVEVRRTAGGRIRILEDTLWRRDVPLVAPVSQGAERWTQSIEDVE